MNKWAEKAWAIPLALFVLHQLMQKVLGVHVAVMDNYLDPFCLGALGLYAIQLERRWLFGINRLSKVDILLVTVFLILVSEVLFPYFSTRFIQDSRDAISISLGACWFMIAEYRACRTA